MLVVTLAMGHLGANLEPPAVAAVDVDSFPQGDLSQHPVPFAPTVATHGPVFTLNTDRFLGIQLICPGVIAVRMFVKDLERHTVTWPEKNK